MTTLAAVLVASLFGSLHCAGMCGPLAAFAVGGSQRRTSGMRVGVHLAYHGGRLTTYGLLGAIAGLVGAALDLGGTLVGLSRIAAVLAGTGMIAVGLIAVLRSMGGSWPQLPVPGGLQRWVLAGQRVALHWGPLPRAAAIGLLTAFLPCGWLYAFVIIAGGTGSLAAGAAVMIAFWLGTVPVLASLGVGLETLTGVLGRRLPLVTALVLVVLGLLTLADRMGAARDVFAARAATGTTLPQQVDAADEELPPCCRQN